MMAQIQAVFAQENLQGIELITPSKEKFYSNLDDAAAKLSALGVSKAENSACRGCFKRYCIVIGNRYPWFHTRAMAKCLDNLDGFQDSSC
jgi:dTDP-4-amino-4,6-dideoxygalactose transaminase